MADPVAPARTPTRPSPASGRIFPLEDPPDFLALHAASPQRYPFLLESCGGSPRLAGFDILAAFPQQRIEVDAGGMLHHPAGSTGTGRDFFAVLDGLRHQDAPPPAGNLPFGGGWFVFLAYELGGLIERRVTVASVPGLPLAMALRIPAALIRDRASQRCFAVVEEDHLFLLDRIRADAAAARCWTPLSSHQLLTAPLEEEDPQHFLEVVAETRRRIAAGDIHQANISRRWSATLAGTAQPWMLHARLRDSNPSPFAALARLDEATSIISSSPERLLRVRGRRIETRPIAGTRPRRHPAMSTTEIRDGLLDNPKERAEHIMLVDLERNDLGQLCRPGTVRVEDFMTVESYAHVHHIVSGIVGDLPDAVGPGQILRAVFPGGSITGAPKPRCMQLIGELEGRPRGAYTGSLGYINHDGSCDFSILIRTMTQQEQQLSFLAGSGIVADSDPALELAETRAKARGMVLGLQA